MTPKDYGLTRYEVFLSKAHSAILFGVGVLVAGFATSWATNYVLTPTEPKWEGSPAIPFQLGIALSAALAALGVVVLAFTSAFSDLAIRWRAWQVLASGAVYGAVLLGGTDMAFRFGVDTLLAPELFWAAAALLPVSFSVAFSRWAAIA